MNKSYKVVFNKARGELVVANEFSKSTRSKSSRTIVASAIIAAIIAGAGSAFAADAYKAGYARHEENKVKTDYYGTSKDVSDDYASRFSDGISGFTNAFYAEGYSGSKKYSWAPSSITLRSETIQVKDGTYGAHAKYGNVNLGGADTKLISINTKGTTVYAEQNSNISLEADDIELCTDNNPNTFLTAVALKSGTGSGSNATPTSLKLNAKNNLHVSSTVEGQAAKAYALSIEGGHSSFETSALLKADTISLKANSEKSGSKSEARSYGIYDSAVNSKTQVDARKISIESASNYAAFGVGLYGFVGTGPDLRIGSSSTETVMITSVGTEGAYGFLAGDTARFSSGLPNIKGFDSDNEGENSSTVYGLRTRSATILGKDIIISAEGKNASGMDLWDNATIIVGDTNSTVNVHASATGGEALGLGSQIGSNLTVNGKELTIETVGDHSIGIHAQNNTQTASENIATVTINSAKTFIKADTALSAMSQGRIYINGDLETESKTAVLARGNALVSVNESGNNIVKLTGDVDFNYNGTNSGTTTDAIVNINLSNADSSWIGNSKTSVDSGTPSEDLRTGQLNLGLSNGATWTPTEIDTSVNNSRAEALASVTLNNGIINLTNAGAKSVDIKKLSGNGTVNADVTKADDGTLTAAGKLNVQFGTSKLSIMAQGITADDVADNNQLAAITGVVNQGVDAAVSTTTTVKEGAVKGEITQTTDDAGNTSTTQSSNSKLTAFNTISDMATMAWRHDMNDLTKRMGELRDSPEGIGSWVRFYGSEQEYGRQNVTSKSTSVQLGSDYDIGSGWKVGGAFTYTDGTAKYDNGSSDNKAYGIAAYGSWLADNGAFVDLIGKYSRLSSDFELNSMDGKSKNNALSASVEAGWHIPFAELAFVEPQAELTYGVVLGDDFTTSNGVKISQEDTEALIGRLGVRTGFHFPNKKGTVYARASVLHDFKGESEFTASLADEASVRSTVKDDIGGTYYEIGVGANFNWTDNAYSYVDLEKQNGGDVKENWRWNVGFRYVW